MQGYRNYILAAIVFLFIAVVVLSAGCGSNNKDKVIWGRSDATEVDINTKVSGRLVKLLVKEGDQVKKGQVLAYIDKRDIEAQIDEAKAKIKTLQAQKKQASLTTMLQGQTTSSAVQAANAAVEKAASDLKLARSNYNRYNSLSASGAVSQVTVDTYRNTLEEATAAYNQAQANLASTNADLLQKNVDEASEDSIDKQIEQAKAALQQVEVSLDETTIRAPFDGVISAKYVNQGAMVSTTTPIVCVQNPLDNWVNIKVPETNLSKYPVGTEVTLIARNGDLKLQGKIVDVSKKAEFATYRSTSERGGQDIITFNVKIQINSPKIRPGMQFHIED